MDSDSKNFRKQYIVLAVLLAVICCVIIIRFWRSSAYKSDIAAGHEFLQSRGLSLHLFSDDNAFVEGTYAEKSGLSFTFEVENAVSGSSDEIKCTDTGLWRQIDKDGENPKLVFQRYDGKIAHEIDIHPYREIDYVDASGNGQFAAYAAWKIINEFDMSMRDVFVCNLSTGEKTMPLSEIAKWSLWSVRLSHDGEKLYHVSDGVVYSLDIAAAEITEIAGGTEVFAFDDGNIGIVNFVEGCYEFYTVDIPGLKKELVYSTEDLFGVIDWDSTGNYISYFTLSSHGSVWTRKNERMPHVFDIKANTLHNFPYGYFKDIIHLAPATMADSGVKVWTID